MRIAYIAAGAAGMYCGSCINDNTLGLGSPAEGSRRCTGSNVYAAADRRTRCKHRPGVLRWNQCLFAAETGSVSARAGFVDRLMNGRVLLNSLSWFSGSTSAEDLGALTVSMLKGDLGSQRKELTKLVPVVERRTPAGSGSSDEFHVSGHGSRDETRDGRTGIVFRTGRGRFS